MSSSVPPSLVASLPLAPPLRLLPRAGGIASRLAATPLTRESRKKETITPSPPRCEQIAFGPLFFPSPLFPPRHPPFIPSQKCALDPRQANYKARSAGFAQRYIPSRDSHLPFISSPHRHRIPRFLTVSYCAYCGFPSARHRLHPSYTTARHFRPSHRPAACTLPLFIFFLRTSHCRDDFGPWAHKKQSSPNPSEARILTTLNPPYAFFTLERLSPLYLLIPKFAT